MRVRPTSSRSAACAAAKVLVTLLLFARGAGAQSCPEVSDVAGDPNAQPLRVTKDATGDLQFTWDTAAVDEYVLQAGDLEPLAREGRYTHAVAGMFPAASADLPRAPGNTYFLVHGICMGEPGSAGRTTSGTERPVEGSSEFSLGIQGGADVFGVRAVLQPAPGVSLVAGSVKPAGLFDRGSGPIPEGLRIVTQGAPETGRLAMLGVFTYFQPDPSFDPPSTAAEPLFLFEARHLGLEPPATVATAEVCEVRTAGNEIVGDAVCVISPLR